MRMYNVCGVNNEDEKTSNCIIFREELLDCYHGAAYSSTADSSQAI